MSSILPDYEYDIFISYRHNDNKREKWVTQFVEAMKDELEATLKNPISIYFDENPHDGLLETHQVSASLKKKLKCLIFIPIISQTYCDTKSYAWSQEFLPFLKMSGSDSLGMNITLSNGNVASRVLPIKIHDLDVGDQQLLESELNGPLRSIDFIHKAAGVNRPLSSEDDKVRESGKTLHSDQINKVANAIKEIVDGLKISGELQSESAPKEIINSPSSGARSNSTSRKLPMLVIGILAILMIAYLAFQYSNKTDIINESSSISTIKSIAVLPFRNMSSDDEQDYFCDGITEDILNDLTQLEGMRVVSRTSSFAFKDKNQDIREIGLKLGVQMIVEGSVRKAGDNLRITAKLINVADGYQLWSKRYDRKIEDVFAIQNEIARQIAQSLEINLTNSNNLVFEKSMTQNVKAYDFYIRGRYYYHMSDHNKVLLGIPMFQKAIEIDKNYALAYSGLADSYSLLYMYYDSNEENLRQALDASQIAVDLDPELAQARSSRGMALAQDKLYQEAGKEFEMAIQLNPKLFDPYYEYGRICRVQGKHDQSAKLFEKAALIEPDNYIPLVFLTSAYETLNMIDEMNESNLQAIKILKKHLALNPDDVRALYLGAMALQNADYNDEATEWMNRAISIDPNGISILYNAACFYARLGKIDEAIDYFERAVNTGYASKEWIKNDSDLDAIRDDPRFIEVFNRMK